MCNNNLVLFYVLSTSFKHQYYKGVKYKLEWRKDSKSGGSDVCNLKLVAHNHLGRSAPLDSPTALLKHSEGHFWADLDD